MLELYQFRHSPFCLKVRMALKAKKLNYRTVEITPGIGQVKIFQKSGQKQVPILIDEENVIHDSSAIVRYLETLSTENQLIPNDPKEAAQVHLIEDWADTTLANLARLALIKAATNDSQLRKALLPEEFPPSIRQIVGGVPLEIFNGISDLFGQGEGFALLENLEQVSNLLKNNCWIVGNQLTIADIAIAAQLSLIRFPASSGTSLAGKGCKGFADSQNLQSLFTWRDQLEAKLMEDDQVLV